VKQLDKDPFSNFVAENPKGNIIKGVVSEVDVKGAMIDLGDGVEGHLRVSELGREKVEDARSVLKVGDEVEAKFTGVDRKKRIITLSIKAKETDEETAAIQNYSQQSTGVSATLGDLLKQQMDGQEEDSIDDYDDDVADDVAEDDSDVAEEKAQ
jgi:small subunit ribosomal protein S1